MSARGPTKARWLRAGERVARALPDWAGSIRFRLTAMYSLFLFALAALVIGGIYVGLDHRLHQDGAVSRQFVVVREEPVPGGVVLSRETVSARYKSVEQLANERALALLRTYSSAALGILFLASLGVGWLVAGRVLRPIDRIAGVARDIQATDLSRRIALDGPPDELKDLADTFDAMLGRLDEAFEGQRRFVQETSHELRNPLAVMRTNLEVALADPGAGEAELRRTGGIVLATVERLSGIVDDLLAHARRQGRPARELVPVDAASVVTDVIAEFAAPAAARHLRLEGSAASTPPVLGDRVALRQALANLVDNAVRLAPQRSTIRVTAGSEGRWVWLAVEDEGPGVAAHEQDLVFRRSWKGEPQDDEAAGEPARSGLGLAIVRQIAEAHGGLAALSPSEGGGSVFAIWLPTAEDPPNASS